MKQKASRLFKLTGDQNVSFKKMQLYSEVFRVGNTLFQLYLAEQSTHRSVQGNGRIVCMKIISFEITESPAVHIRIANNLCLMVKQINLKFT